MLTGMCDTISGARFSCFATRQGVAESTFIIESDPQTSIADALDCLLARYENALAKNNLSADSLVFARVYLSDIENQKEFLAASKFRAVLGEAALSIVGQTPLCGGPAALHAYHISRDGAALARRKISAERNEWRNDFLVTGEHYRMLWSASYGGRPSLAGSGAQSSELLGALAVVIEKNNMTLLANTIRTWIYVRDIDNNYKGMVDTRRDFFAAHGLTKESRYLASTGIEAQSGAVQSLVSMDALSIGGLQPAQIVCMHAFSHLSPTIDYGVTFERGLRVRFGDRSHLYISGTASIDNKGEVLFPGDIRGQTARTMENVAALLKEQGAGLSDLGHLVIYVRDPNASREVLKIIRPLVQPELPIIILRGPVCRPAWLVEVEGVAVIEDKTDFAPFL